MNTQSTYTQSCQNHFCYKTKLPQFLNAPLYRTSSNLMLFQPLCNQTFTKQIKQIEMNQATYLYNVRFSERLRDISTNVCLKQCRNLL